MPDTNRRGLLRGLATLPLIGGSVTLIGRPTGAVTPATDQQLAQYACFALNECQLVMQDFQARGVFDTYRLPPAMEQHRAGFPGHPSLAFRAPVIMAAAGVALAGGAHG